MIRWFKQQSLFFRLALVFLFTTAGIVVSSYYVVNWGYTGRDDILDAHDAYLYNNLVSSWGSPPDVSLASKELDNLKLKCSVFIADKDTSCSNDTLIYWSNHIRPLSLCNYLSYGSTVDYAASHGIQYKDYVSFGDVEFDKDIIQATFVHQRGFKYLITLDIPPTPTPSFFPFIVL